LILIKCMEKEVNSRPVKYFLKWEITKAPLPLL
jgi:hypothetical protein